MPKARDYKREWELAVARGAHKDNAARHRLRRLAEKKGLVHKNDGKDIDHKDPLSKGGANTLGNARVATQGKNRSFARNPDSSLKSQTSRRERKKK